MKINKSDLMRLHKCVNWFWLHKHQRESLAKVGNPMLAEEGNRFENLVRSRFSSGILVDCFGESAIRKTTNLAGQRTATIFQATASHDDFFAIADVLHPVADDAWELYEVKASTNLKNDHLIDVAIQRAVFSDAGYKLAKCFVICLNSGYILGNSLVPDQLIQINDVTDRLDEMIDTDIRPLMCLAKEIINCSKLPEPDIAKLRCKPTGSSLCPCTPVSYANLPDESVFEISRITRKQTNVWINQGIVAIAEVPTDSNQLSPHQRRQVKIAKTRTAHIDHQEICQKLGQLRYPLAFLDYESINPAIPTVEGYKAYQHFVFQYSLHILDSPDSSPRHCDFLAGNMSTQSSLELVNQLQSDLPESVGSVIVWNESFEKTRNKELGRLHPEAESYFNGLNDRMFDLMKLFSDQLWLDHRFRGRTSIKVVLPVLCPELSYENLAVQNGTDAMERWSEMISYPSDSPECQQMGIELREYCSQDTFAMVRIFQVICDQCGLSNASV